MVNRWQRRTVLIGLSALIALIDTVFVSTNHYFTQQAHHEHLQEDARQLEASFNVLLSKSYDHLLAMATFIANDHQVQDLMQQAKHRVAAEGGGPGGRAAAEIRTQLMARVGDNWALLQDRFNTRQLHFHLGPGSTSFLRVHRPDKFGDNMDDLRHIIVDTNRTQAAHAGFETGRVYAGLRGVVPIFSQDSIREHVGALEVGASFGSILDVLDERYNVGVGVLLSSDHVDSTMLPSFVQKRFTENTRPLCDCVIEASTRKEVLAMITAAHDQRVDMSRSGVQILEVDGHYYSFSHFPIRDYLGDLDTDRPAVGTVVFWRNADTLMADYHTALRFNIIYGVLGYLAVELLLLLGLRLLTQHLELQVQRRTQDLAISEMRATEAQQIAHLGHWELDLEKQQLYWSDEVFSIFGLDAAQFAPSYEGFLARIHPDDREIVDRAYRQSLNDQSTYQVVHRLLLDDGTIKYVSESGKSFFDVTGQPLRSVGTIQDITDRLVQEEQLQLAHLVFMHAREGIVVIDLDGRVVDLNPAFTQITGYTRTEIIGRDTRVFSAPEHDRAFYQEIWHTLRERGEWQGELWSRRKSGEAFAELLSISTVHDHQGAACYYVVLFSDVTEQREQREALEHIAYFDPLTHLPNRRLLGDRLEQALLYRRRTEGHLAVAYLDLDGFKAVNDQFGHEYGDALLIALAKRMCQVVRESDTVARMGGMSLSSYCWIWRTENSASA